MSTKCEVRDCQIDTYEHNSKCILHCDKTIDNNWIFSGNRPIEPHKAKSNTDDILYWNEEKVEVFWNVLFDEIKNKIFKNVKRGQQNTTNEAIRVIGNKKKYGFYLNFLDIKFPPVRNDFLKKHIHSNNTIIKNNQFQNCTFYDNCVINISDLKLIFHPIQSGIKEITTNRPNQFYHCIFEQNFILHRPGSTEESIDLDDCKIKKRIELTSDFKNIRLNKIEALVLCIKDGSFGYKKKSELDSFSLTESKIKKITIDNKIINQFEINNLESHKIVLKNSELKKISIKKINTNIFSIFNIDLTEDSKASFETIKTKVLSIKRLSQDAKYIQLHNIDVAKRFYCERVEFKNTYFNDFNIKNAIKEIKKVSFIDAHLNSIQWGNIFEIKSSKDMFRQLKFVNDQQGNHIEANDFYAKEMTTHKKETLDKQQWLSKWWQEKLIFLFGEKLSNFGQSWFLPLLWLMLLNLFFYTWVYIHASLILIFLTLLALSWSVGKLAYKLLSNARISFYTAQHIALVITLILLIYYFSLGNIQKFTEFMSIRMPNKGIVYDKYLHIWYLNKAVSSFIIYYFIVALRKHTRR
ncbi:hypothetical protein [uncultured Sulfuricurvum sp.]|uniref:hypothetical protein n=1 Tax=uncultured Sulfuricurvum sp. TaxID=430693 RepID=UPI002604E0BA|nr:hypothetical protein [uncultured Sulfuricurvum sp.]